MSKNPNSITIIITLLDIEIIKTEKKKNHYHCVGNYKKRKTEKKYINIIALLGIKKTKLKKKNYSKESQ